MSTSLLSRVGFSGGNGGGDQPPPLDTTPDVVPGGLDPDPAPAPATRDKREARKSAASANTAKSQPRSGGKFVSKDEQKSQVAAELDTALKLLAFTWSLSDEHCSTVLNDTSAKIARDLGQLVSHSEWLTEKITKSGILLDSIRFLTSITPLIKAIWSHHVVRADEGVTDDLTDQLPTVDPVQYGPWRPQFTG